MDRDTAHALADFAEQSGPGLDGLDRKALFAQLEERHGELLAAIAWFLDERQPNGAMRIANALARFWTATGRLEEGSQWFGHILAAANGSEAYFGRACSEAGLVESGGATMSGPLHFTVERLRLADGAAMRPYPRSP